MHLLHKYGSVIQLTIAIKLVNRSKYFIKPKKKYFQNLFKTFNLKIIYHHSSHKVSYLNSFLGVIYLMYTKFNLVNIHVSIYYTYIIVFRTLKSILIFFHEMFKKKIDSILIIYNSLYKIVIHQIVIEFNKL